MFDAVTPQRRSRLAVPVSLALHVATAFGIAGLAYTHVPQAQTPQVRLKYIPLVLPQAEPQPEAAVAPPSAAPEPPTVEPPPTPSPRSVAPPPPTRVVQVGDFAAAPTPVARVEPRHIETTGFETQQAVAYAMTAHVAETGAFEAPDRRATQPETDRLAGSVVSSGFANSEPTSTNRGTARAVTGSGFAAAATRGSTPQKSEVKAVGFADPPSPQTTAAVRPTVDPTFRPVEVRFKPTPGYSEEARSLRIEGEVTIEIDFCATGQIRVMRVIRGLGHGLDDLAVRAAEQIRFTPAQSGGHPIDFRADLQIVFRLT
jgi:TonB family protein